MDDELWRCYAFWSCILILKMMSFTWFTGRLRVARKVIHSETDRIFMEGPGVILDPTGGGHPDVDRIRAAHHSDVEIVIPFLLISLLWLETSPSLYCGRLVLSSFSIARIFHGLVYMEIIPVVHRLFGIFISIFSYIVVSYVAILLIISCT